MERKDLITKVRQFFSIEELVCPHAYRKWGQRCWQFLDTAFLEMLYVIRNMGNLKNQPESLKHEIFTRIFRACEIAKFDEDKRIQYDQDMYDERRRIGELKTAEMIGLERGREEGREEANMANAAKLKQLGVDVEIISQATGLDVEIVKEL